MIYTVSVSKLTI